MSDFLDDAGSIAKTLIGFGAPILGTAIGGPLGGAAGKILASVLGASDSTPGVLADMLGKMSPEAAQAKVAEAEAKWVEAVRAEAQTAQVVATQVGETSRAEVMSDDLFTRRARPSTLYAFSLTAAGFGAVVTLGCAMVFVQAVMTGKADLLTPAFSGAATLISAMVTLLGVMAFPATGFVMSRGRQKEAEITGQPPAPGLLGSIASAIRSGRS